MASKKVKTKAPPVWTDTRPIGQIQKELSDVLSNFAPGSPCARYITHARFPNFKNLEPGANVSFPFPITALVGANGSGKSSFLHALWGMPQGYSTSRFWFSTKLDPIDDTLGPPRYVYGHWHSPTSAIVETRKARVGAKADYWEPTKATVGDGMQPVPPGKIEGKSSDRWNPVVRDVCHVNFKNEFGAFERFLLDLDDENREARHRRMIARARLLKKVVDEELSSCYTYKKERIVENRQLDEMELGWVNYVLGHEYSRARLVRHKLYPGSSGTHLSVVFSRPNHADYSEAYAGSGEAAVVSAVVKLLASPRESLLLLDEPETSLHPAAQQRLLVFLLWLTKERHHQVFMSTHSPDLIEGLPPSSILLFEETAEGKSRVIGNVMPLVAFHRLGRSSNSKKLVVVEDPVARCLLVAAARFLDEAEQKLLDIVVVPGGAGTILGSYIPSLLAAQGGDTYVVLDGDQKKVDEFTDPDTIAKAKKVDFSKLLSEEIGCEPSFYLDGNTTPSKASVKQQQTQEFSVRYLKWARARLRYLPTATPEELVLRSIGSELGQGADPKSALFSRFPPNTSAKDSVSMIEYMLFSTEGAELELSGLVDFLKVVCANPSTEGYGV